MKLFIDTGSTIGRIKPMNAVNNGPVYTKNADQNSTNLPAYRDAHIPFARTHDASIYYSYGGEHTVDVANIFTDFDADPDDPASYDFELTDVYMENIGLAGTEVFFRLGNKIEHWQKKYGIIPPKDFKKWAVVCEHIIRHMNEGWADGHNFGIRYWEIWNEPDLYGKCWLGTPEQFYELFSITARHLKSCFPELKIGGPAVCGFNEGWLRGFFDKMRSDNVPLDFYSWHIYARDVSAVVNEAKRHRAILDEYGYTEAETILDEWNYVRGWSGDDWKYSIDTINNIKGAAFTAAVMTACQSAPVDMLMYYDARTNSSMNGLFSLYNYRTQKGYYPIKTWGELLLMGGECAVKCDIPGIYAAAARDDDGHAAAMITYYTDDDSALPITFTVEIAGGGIGELVSEYLLDGENDLTKVGLIAADNGRFTLTMKPNTVIVLK